jgi:hypothetical protein
MNRTHFGLACLLMLPGILLAQAKGKAPPCYGEENSATQSALVEMVNAGLIKDFASIYIAEKKPYHLKTDLLSSTKIGKYSAKDFPPSDVHRQIQKFEVNTKEGQSFEVLTISEATFVECSMSSPTIIVISPEFRVLNVGTSALKTPNGTEK